MIYKFQYSAPRRRAVVFGVGDRDPIFRVFGVKDRTHNKDIRIDMQNYAAWDVLSQ